MPKFRFYTPIDVRYGDLDPQGHVNNAKYLTYFEHARISYIKNLGLWRSASFSDIGIILADVQITFIAPVYFGTDLLVSVRVTRLGNKSMTMEYCLEEACSGREYATGASVLVTYDYPSSDTIPIPANWRKAIIEFERLPAAPEAQ